MTDNRGMDVSDDVDPTDGRDESLNERMDRNWNEILQELRVTQTGTQIFTGFLLTIAFQAQVQRTDHLPGSGLSRPRDAAVLTTALGLAPVSLHRSLFREGAKMTIVQTAHVILRIMLVGVAVMLIGTVLLIFDLVVDRRAALIVAGVTLLVLIILAALPVLVRSGRRRAKQDQLKGGIMPGKKKPGPSVKDDKVYEAIRDQGAVKGQGSSHRQRIGGA